MIQITNYELPVKIIGHWNWCIVVFLLMLFSCTTVDLPTIEESDKKIEEYSKQLDGINQSIDLKTKSLPSGNNIDIFIKKDMLNRLFWVLANNRKDDIMIIFTKTKNLLKDEKNILGVQYTNSVDIEKGQVALDLKSLKLMKLENNKFRSMLEIEGKGDISLSGKHTGISASVTSGIDIYMNDDVEFVIENSLKGGFLLRPVQKKLYLKTKFSIAFLKWNIPWREEVEIEFSDILSPVFVPMNLSTEVDLPLPSKTKNIGEFDYLTHTLIFSDVKIQTIKEKLIWKSNIKIMNKK